jgi:hypothetical protein
MYTQELTYPIALSKTCHGQSDQQNTKQNGSELYDCGLHGYGRCVNDETAFLFL